MNRIEFNGKKLLDLDEANNTKKKKKKQVSSDEITKIQVVNEYPENEEQGVLYIKLESDSEPGSSE